MKALMLALISTVACIAVAQDGWISNTNGKNQLISESNNYFKQSGHFYPYFTDRPYADSSSNLYTRTDVVQLFQEQAPKIARHIDPNTLYPVVTADQPNTFVFFIDLKSMTAADEDSCQAFLHYFLSHKGTNEDLKIYRMDRSGEFTSASDFPDGKVPALKSISNTEWIPVYSKQNYLSMDMTQGMNYIINLYGQQLNGMPYTTYMYIGRVSNYSGNTSNLQDLQNLGYRCRNQHVYLHSLNFDQPNNIHPFNRLIKRSGGATLLSTNGIIQNTTIILNKLVMYYLYDHSEDIQTICSNRDTATNEWIGLVWNIVRKEGKEQENAPGH